MTFYFLFLVLLIELATALAAELGELCGSSGTIGARPTPVEYGPRTRSIKPAPMWQQQPELELRRRRFTVVFLEQRHFFFR